VARRPGQLKLLASSPSILQAAALPPTGKLAERYKGGAAPTPVLAGANVAPAAALNSSCLTAAASTAGTTEACVSDVEGGGPRAAGEGAAQTVAADATAATDNGKGPVEGLPVACGTADPVPDVTAPEVSPLVRDSCARAGSCPGQPTPLAPSRATSGRSGAVGADAAG